MKTAGERAVEHKRHRVPAILRDRKGATAVEYGLIVALIVIAMIAGLQGLAGVKITMCIDLDTKVTEPTR